MNEVLSIEVARWSLGSLKLLDQVLSSEDWMMLDTVNESVDLSRIDDPLYEALRAD